MSRLLRAGPPGSVVPAPVLATLLLPAFVSASSFDNNPKILLHLTAVTAKNVCTYGRVDCEKATTRGYLSDPARGPGIG